MKDFAVMSDAAEHGANLMAIVVGDSKALKLLHHF